MTNVRKYTDKELFDRVAALPSFKGWPQGPLDIWVRSQEDEFNRFDDKVYSFLCFGDVNVPIFQMVCTGTTNAGAEGLKHYEKYNSLGCAVLQSDVIVYNSHEYGKHKGQYYAYRQVKPFPYYRDADKDNKAEEEGKVYNDIIYANCHKAGVNSIQIGGWSVACLVRNVTAEFDKWMKYMMKRPLSVVIIKESN